MIEMPKSDFMIMKDNSVYGDGGIFIEGPTTRPPGCVYPCKYPDCGCGERVEMPERRLPPGWWIVPAMACGLAVWLTLAWWV